MRWMVILFTERERGAKAGTRWLAFSFLLSFSGWSPGLWDGATRIQAESLSFRYAFTGMPRLKSRHCY